MCSELRNACDLIWGLILISKEILIKDLDNTNLEPTEDSMLYVCVAVDSSTYRYTSI